MPGGVEKRWEKYSAEREVDTARRQRDGTIEADQQTGRLAGLPTLPSASFCSLPLLLSRFVATLDGSIVRPVLAAKTLKIANLFL